MDMWEPYRKTVRAYVPNADAKIVYDRFHVMRSATQTSTRTSVRRPRGHFPTDEAATKLLYLALRNILGKWKRGNHAWHAAMPHLSLLFAERFTNYT